MAVEWLRSITTFCNYILQQYTTLKTTITSYNWLYGSVKDNWHKLQGSAQNYLTNQYKDVQETILQVTTITRFCRMQFINN